MKGLQRAQRRSPARRILHVLGGLLLHKSTGSIASLVQRLDRDGEIDKKLVVRRLIEESDLDIDFYFLLVIAVLITSFGLLLNNAAVVIGGMIVSPLLSPIIALGLGIVTFNKESLVRALKAIVKSILIVLVLSSLTVFILGVNNQVKFEMLQRVRFSLPFLYIAVLSGVAAAYSWIRPRLSVTIYGVAIAVALLPPLCVTGIGMSLLSTEIMALSFLLFLVNLLGISVSSAVVFSVFGFRHLKEVEKREIIKERRKK